MPVGNAIRPRQVTWFNTCYLPGDIRNGQQLSREVNTRITRRLLGKIWKTKLVKGVNEVRSQGSFLLCGCHWPLIQQSSMSIWQNVHIIATWTATCHSNRYNSHYANILVFSMCVYQELERFMSLQRSHGNLEITFTFNQDFVDELSAQENQKNTEHFT